MFVHGERERERVPITSRERERERARERKVESRAEIERLGISDVGMNIVVIAPFSMREKKSYRVFSSSLMRLNCCKSSFSKMIYCNSNKKRLAEN